MQIIFNHNNMVEHIKEVKQDLDEVLATRRIHKIFIPIIILLLNFIICFLTEKYLLPSLISFLLIPFILKLLFSFLPSCLLPVIPTPKMLYFEALRRGKILKMEIEAEDEVCLITITLENGNGEKEEMGIAMEIEEREDIKEDILDFEQGVLFISGKEGENREVEIQL